MATKEYNNRAYAPLRPNAVTRLNEVTDDERADFVAQLVAQLAAITAPLRGV